MLLVFPCNEQPVPLLWLDRPSNENLGKSLHSLAASRFHPELSGSCLQINPSLAVYCQGGKAPPRNCANEFYTNTPDYTRCVCKEKYYEDGANGCVVCPKGHYCVDGTKTQCPAHTYQDNTGEASCKSCSSDRTAQGIYSGCPDKQQLQWCDIGATSLQCVTCSRCRRPYVPETTEGQVNCYRSA